MYRNSLNIEKVSVSYLHTDMSHSVYAAYKLSVILNTGYLVTNARYCVYSIVAPLYILFAGEWRNTEGKTFSSNIDSELQQHNAEYLLECQALCQQNSACVAITYNDNRPSDKTDCILRNITKNGLSQDEFKDKAAVDYYELVGKSINSINISNFSGRSK